MQRAEAEAAVRALEAWYAPRYRPTPVLGSLRYRPAPMLDSLRYRPTPLLGYLRYHPTRALRTVRG